MNYLYNDYPRDLEKWSKLIKSKIKKIKINKFDENETDFIETDLVLNFYMMEYKNLRKQIMTKCCDLFNEK
jgi:hypothetical protein